MITSCYPNGTQNPPTFGGIQEEIVFPSSNIEHNSSNPTTHQSSFHYNLSVLKDKVHQVQSLATLFISNDHHGQPHESTAMAMPTMGTLIQEIIAAASSMMFACQQIALGAPTTNNNTNTSSRPDEAINPNGQLAHPGQNHASLFGAGQHEDTVDQWYGEDYNNCNSNNNSNSNSTRVIGSIVTNNNDYSNKRDCVKGQLPQKTEPNEGSQSPKNYDIIELDAADLLAKYTHYCQVCGKGFKRDANLRMHMRAHGNEYKSSAALSNPMKHQNKESMKRDILPRKYSCPHEGCRWNKNHAKFQPLKSMICVKNHYKRSHCPKMYVCKRCNRKQFSVLSDLRTHEKHCGDSKWLCSCGTTFSRKDKLMGHVSLFVGHTPAIDMTANTAANGGQSITKMDIERR